MLMCDWLAIGDATLKGKEKGKVLIINIAVLRNQGLLQDRFNNTPLDHSAHTRQLQAAPKHIDPHKVPNYTAW